MNVLTLGSRVIGAGAGLRVRRRVPRRDVQRRAAPPAPARQGPRDRGRGRLTRRRDLGATAERSAGTATDAGGCDDERSQRRRRATRAAPRRRHGRVRGGRRPRPRRALGGAAVRPRHVALVDGRARPGRDRATASAGSTRRPISRDQIAALEGFGDGIRDAGFTTAVVGGMGGSSLAPDVLHRTFGTRRRLARPARPRLDRPGGRRRDRRRPRPARDPLDRREQVRHDDRAARLPGRRLGPRRGGAPRAPRAAQRARRRADGRDHRSRQERRGDPPPRRAPRGLPQPARHRRPLLGADLRRARAGQPDRPRPRRRSSRRRWRWLGACREPDPAANPGRQPRARHRRRSRRPAATS